MDKMGILCFVVALLEMISAGAGFAAEVTRVKASQVKLDSFRQCSYPQSPALLFSIISAATILMAQIIINALLDKLHVSLWALLGVKRQNSEIKTEYKHLNIISPLFEV
ncbi:hypothetical protein EPI10_002996 [Gossypium australe]|uniref:CASP-like protein n=1 Tax=Gossypium australe TaxID=47621 RepID=A0A5B6VFV7_9ROSI|nr:hypothetical protein EPI10_002996 [Gossypium australe]